MKQREFDITIGPGGEVKLHVRGFKGKSCLEVVKMFEKVVGKVQSQQLTSEFYEPEEHVRFHIDQHQ